MIFSTCRLKLKLSNAQILCPEGHKLIVNKIPNSKELVLYCKKCKQFYPLPYNNALCESSEVEEK